MESHHQQQQQQQEEILSCKLRTISKTENVLGTLTSHQLDRIRTLNLECSDVMFFESTLESNRAKTSFLGKLNRLQELRIEYCKIRYIPNKFLSTVQSLRTLSIRTHNSDWSAMSLDFHPESFHGLTELRTLDLAENNIWSLPTDVFCPLYSLRELNLTGNRINDVSQLGFADWANNSPTLPGKACNTALEVLDMSGNDVTFLPDNGLSSLRSLQSLLLQDNLLTSLADRSLAGLGMLKVLNMSSNKIIALPPELFQFCKRINQIHLQNNSLSVLAPGLFEGLDRLEVLDLSRNDLTSTWVNRDTFAGLIRLVVLNLSNNRLTKIDQHVFRGLYSLQILDLERNNIESIAENAFTDLKNLHALNLSNNRLRQIDAFHLSELYVLQQLLLEANLIETIHSRSFENLTNLSDLSLNDNLLTEIPDGLSRLRFLKSLDLGKNQIQSVRNSSFVGLDELLGLRLVDNLITNISRDAFAALKSLHVLNLASNQIKHVDQSAFISNPTIRAIRLDNNQLEDISGVFTSLPALVWLNVSDNKLRWFDYSHLPLSLEWLDMHKNNISELGNYFDVRNSLQIKMLDVSFNQLTAIEDVSIPDSIETIFLNNNQIDEVAPGSFLKKRNLEKVVLYGNKIQKFEIAALALSPVPDSREIPQFYIGDNPFHCDCNMEWLQRVNELSYLRQHPRVLDLDQVMCIMEHDREVNTRPLMDIHPQEFLCKYESHCFALCHCCDYDACDCKMTCPDRCTCYHDHAWSANIVDCGNANYSDVPERIPMDATTIYLDGNNFGEMGSHVFIGKKKLENLYLNNSNILSIHNRTFNGVPSLKLLNMGNNKIEKLNGFEFEQLPNLNKLYLDHNSISFVGKKTFSQLESLQVLTLSENQIVDFTPWQQLPETKKHLASLSLQGNKWKCDCSTVMKLNEWLRENVTDSDMTKILCTDDRPIMTVLEECENHLDEPMATPAIQKTFLNDNEMPGYLPILAGVMIALFGTILLVTLSCIFRQEIRLWAHSKYGIRFCKDTSLPNDKSDDDEKLYDGYMVYSAQDSDFVVRQISSELEQAGYSLCLHHRDIHSTAFLADSLQSAADASRKLVLVLSINFLQMEWSNPHFRVALQAVLELIRPSRRRNKLILILTAPVNIVAMDPIMDILIRTCTVICWNDKRFWDKLRFAMPDVKGLKAIKNKADISKSPNLRYTPAPTNTMMIDSWNRRPYPGGMMIMGGGNIGGGGGGVIQMQETPTHSAYNTEDEFSLSQQYESPGEENYGSRSSASLAHVYSTIPDTPSIRNGNEMPCFV